MFHREASVETIKMIYIFVVYTAKVFLKLQVLLSTRDYRDVDMSNALLKPVTNLDVKNAVNYDAMGEPVRNLNSKGSLSYDDMFNDDFNFDMNSHDVMVFLHMQKTGKM